MFLTHDRIITWSSHQSPRRVRNLQYSRNTRKKRERPVKVQVDTRIVLTVSSWGRYALALGSMAADWLSLSLSRSSGSSRNAATKLEVDTSKGRNPGSQASPKCEDLLPYLSSHVPTSSPRPRPDPVFRAPGCRWAVALPPFSPPYFLSLPTYRRARSGCARWESIVRLVWLARPLVFLRVGGELCRPRIRAPDEWRGSGPGSRTAGPGSTLNSLDLPLPSWSEWREDRAPACMCLPLNC